jgi:hypothetical protein
MKRREFITLLGGAAVAWPLAARAQQTDRVRRVGVLMGYGEADPEAKALLSEFTHGLSELGWTDGRNLRMDVRWAPGRTDLMHTFAKELVNLQPDVILADSTPVTAALKRETLTIPIVFAAVADPVGSGFVASLPRPGGNITGFGSLETSMASKWLVKRAVMMFNPETAPYIKSYVLPSFEAAARSLRVAPSQVTTAQDQAVLGRAIQERFPRYYKYFSTVVFVYHGHAIQNHNHLLGSVEGVDGIKTGFTRASGFNLVTSVRRGGRHLVAVVLGGRTSAQRAAHMRELISSNFKLASLGQDGPVAAEKAEPVEAPRPPQVAFPEGDAALQPGSTEPIRPLLVKTITYHTATLQW